MKLKKQDIVRISKNIFFVVAGTVILAFGTAIFILPFDLLVGGISSYAIIFEKILPFDISIDLIITIITWTLFFIGLIVLGKDFAIKTLISTIVYPIAISLFLKMTDPSFFGGFLCLETNSHSELTLLAAAVAGGVLIGLGCAIAFLGGGSTGGTDIIAFTICKVFKKLRSSVVIFCVDGAAIVLGLFIINDIIMTLLGILSVLISAIVIDKVFLGGNQAFVAQIVTQRHDEINKQIIEKLGRTTTIFNAIGGYTGEERKMVSVTFTMNQYSTLMTIIKEADPSAFTTIHRAHECGGKGWTK
ncbi:MAG: YitT family protein [Ruminococcaceae bacterium]|nr:YitT family protein [Oscillospiraceae bacterium]